MKGNKTYRHDQNPEEKRFHDEFIKQHGDHNMSAIVLEPKNGGMSPSRHLTPEEENIVVSGMQWLGSPLGQSFLRDMGYEKPPERTQLLKRGMTDKKRKYIAKRCKKVTGWYTMSEVGQDKQIKLECERLGYDFVDFFAADGKFLNKILKR